MTHGGGTVAGESPDKSEQRKSSGETTPGERDPRLAVFRQASPGVDQPTTVFKLPEPVAEPGGTEPAASSESSEPSTSSTSSTESGSRENDARLRAAVAAWVAGADAPDSADSAAQQSENVPADSASALVAPREDTESSDDSADPAEDEADGDADEDAEADESRLSAELAPEPPAPAVAEAPEDGDDSDADDAAEAAASDEAAEADESRLSAELAPEPPAPAVAEAPEDGDDSDADDAAEAAGEASADGAGEPAAQAAPGTDAETAPEAAETAADGDADVDESRKPTDTSASPDEADGGGSRTPADADSDATPPADTDEAPEAPEAAASAAPGKDADSGRARKPSWAAKADDAPDDAGESRKPSASATAKPVDQPTTTLKSPQKPRVDHPTTALKLPPAARPEVKPAEPVEPVEPAEPAEPADRSSKFVPLRVGEAAPASLAESERTKQQPMPPLPPLDLLAELTNTPPPPQTAVRTVFRRIKIWTPLVVLLLIVFAVVQAVRPLPAPALTLSAEPEYAFKGGQLTLPWPGEGQGAVEVEGVGSIGTYGAQKPAPIASVAKTMTAYVILKEHPISGEQVGPKITVDQQAEDESKNDDESTAAISKGQQFTEKQMLQLLMIPSGNNAARLLARWDSTTEAEFVKKMNDAAKDLGMTGTTYTDPSGLKATTVSTPQDQLKLAKAVMQNDIFREIVDTTLTTIPGINGTIRNNNDAALLEPGVGGIKTGSSTPAGGNLLWSANVEVDGKIRRIVGITMGVQNAAILNDKLELAIDHSIKVIKAAQDGVTSATVVKKGQVVGYVDDGLGGRTAVVATKDLKAVGWGGLKVEIAMNDGGKALPHSAKAGTVVGQVSVGSGTGKVTAPVALQQDLAEPGFGDKLTRLG
ncbi:serine hydrolase [Streptomyces sp. NPDC020681]|uniref:serine hydrolase n=1 Tax=Streptomyces sp. NPDC020681 TaxID=3365083 RepID=UPI0037A6208D